MHICVFPTEATMGSSSISPQTPPRNPNEPHTLLLVACKVLHCAQTIPLPVARGPLAFNEFRDMLRFNLRWGQIHR